MKITNPTDTDITIQVKGGTKYTVLANDTLSNVPTEHANFWKGLHPFLKVTADPVIKKEKIEEVVEDKVEEVIDELVDTPEEETTDEPKEEVEDKKSSKKITKSKK